MTQPIGGPGPRADQEPPKLVLTSWSAVSPLGIGAALLAAGIRDACPVVFPLDREQWPVPQSLGGVVPGFDPRETLGEKGTRSMDRATALAVTTAGLLLRGAALAQQPERIGLVLGTNTGSAQSMMDFTRDSLTEDKPFYVDPARFPNTVMNCAAGRCAIWYGLRGPNTTIAADQVTGLMVLTYAARLLRAGRADAVLCGAVEEMSVQRSWLEWHSRDEAARENPLGEGCAMFVLEPAEGAASRGRRPLAELVSAETGMADRTTPISDVLERCIHTVLSRARVRPDDVFAVAASSDNDAERDAVKAALGGAAPRQARAFEVLGDTGAASAAFQLAGLLAIARGEPRALGRAGLVTSAGRDGATGCALIRFC